MILYKVHRYYGDEYTSDTKIAKTYQEAERLGMMAEHWEIEQMEWKLKKDQ